MKRDLHSSSYPALVSALFVGAGVCVLFPFASLGPLSSHMLTHIVLMSVAAPLLAVFGVWRSPIRQAGALQLWTATALQIALLYFWHLPVAHHFATMSASGVLIMHASLLVAAVVFWDALVRFDPAHQWQGIVALLITGKLACLLAVLLVFAAKPLLHHHGYQASMDDQQLAGVLMIAACPASYVLAALIMATQFLGVLSARQARAH